MNSITIVKNGDAEKSQKAKGLTKRFECAVCGCVFDATNDTRDFYSRTSCEVRLFGFYLHLIKSRISTHAPHARCD